MWELFIGFLGEWAVELGGGAAFLAITEFFFSPFRSLRARFKKPEKVEIANPESMAAVNPSSTAPSEPVVTLTLIDFQAQLDAREKEVSAKLKDAHAEDRALLQSQLDELAKQKVDPEPALKEAQELISDLEARLEREGNELDADKRDAASKALETGDYSAADALFAEIEARAAPAVGSAARAAYARGEIAEAEVRWADAATHYARAAGLEPNLVNLFKAREFAWRSGDYPAALRFGEQGIALARETGDQTNVSKFLNEHALTLCSNGGYDEAEPLYREAIKNAEVTLGKDHPDYANCLNNLASLLEATVRYGEAESLYRKAMAIIEATLGKDHPTYSTNLNNIAGLLEATGRYGEAEPLYRQAMMITEATLGKEHPTYAAHLNNIAGLYYNMERLDEALPLMEQTLTIVEATLGSEHPNTKSARKSLAEIRKAAGQ